MGARERPTREIDRERAGARGRVGARASERRAKSGERERERVREKERERERERREICVDRERGREVVELDVMTVGVAWVAACVPAERGCERHVILRD